MTKEEMYSNPLYLAISARLGDAAQELRVESLKPSPVSDLLASKARGINIALNLVQEVFQTHDENSEPIRRGVL